MDNRKIIILVCFGLLTFKCNAQLLDTLKQKFIIEVGPETVFVEDVGYALTYRMRKPGLFNRKKKFNYHLFWNDGVVYDPKLQFDSITTVLKTEELCQKIIAKINGQEGLKSTKCKSITYYKLELSIVVIRSESDLWNYKLTCDENGNFKINFFVSRENYFIFNIL